MNIEPEVLSADLSRIRCKALASTIAQLIAEHEPMLRATAEGATANVRVLGDPGVMQFTVEEISKEGRVAQKAPASNSK